MSVTKTLKGAAKAVKGTTRKVVRKTETVLNPAGNAVASEAKAIKKAVKRGSSKRQAPSSR
jgi:hypothetical protein